MDATDFIAEVTRLAAPLAPDPAVLRTLTAAIRVRSVAKGQHLVRQGEPFRALYFVRSGVIRYYYLSNGVEYTGQFFDEGTVFADVHALLTGAGCLQNIVAVEASIVLEIPYPALLAAYEADHALERTGRRWMEEGVAGSQRRTANLLQLKPDERYARFVATRPDLARRVPQFLIASYLGITPEALSRIRRRRLQTPRSA
ncbi:MAG: Crp/Fnr family transcriptional regulator [Caulobacter sp.]